MGRHLAPAVCVAKGTALGAATLTLRPMLRLAAAGAIGAYQRHISPWKGFRCAHRAHTGRVSCSEFGRRLVLRVGVIGFLRMMPRQFARCRAAFAALQADAARRRKTGRSILDACDCGGCDPNVCDCGGLDLPCDCSF